MKYYTGIGSRETPPSILALMTRLAAKLEADDYILRSGGAGGADTAFEAGAKTKEIFLPWPGFNESTSTLHEIPELAMYIASTLHPAWNKLSQGAKKLMGRNVQQVCGTALSLNSSFVICWTPDGCDSASTRTSKTGGTGLAISLADKLGIQILNLANPEALSYIKNYLEE